MELKAENSFTVTEELSREGTYRLLKDEYFPLMYKLAAAVGAAWLVLAAVTVWRHGSLAALGFSTLAAAVLVCWILVLRPRSRAKKNWEQVSRRSGDLTRTTRFYEDRLEVDTGGNKFIVNYEDISRVLESKHLLILVNNERTGVMSALDGFTLGNKETVLELVREWSR